VCPLFGPICRVQMATDSKSSDSLPAGAPAATPAAAASYWVDPVPVLTAFEVADVLPALSVRPTGSASSSDSKSAATAAAAAAAAAAVEPIHVVPPPLCALIGQYCADAPRDGASSVAAGPTGPLGLALSKNPSKVSRPPGRLRPEFAPPKHRTYEDLLREARTLELAGTPPAPPPGLLAADLRVVAGPVLSAALAECDRLFALVESKLPAGLRHTNLRFTITTADWVRSSSDPPYGLTHRTHTRRLRTLRRCEPTTRPRL
jgi:hypothetical protein